MKGLNKKLFKRVAKFIESKETENLHEGEVVAYIPVKIGMSNDGKHIGMIMSSTSEIINMYNRIIEEEIIEEIRRERNK